jgi:hypothetical protein
MPRRFAQEGEAVAQEGEAAALVGEADSMHTCADIVQTLNRHYADYHARVHLAHVPYRALGLQDLRGIKETGHCSLLPGASMGQEARRPRVYAPVQYLKEGSDSSPDDTFFAWW